MKCCDRPCEKAGTPKELIVPKRSGKRGSKNIFSRIPISEIVRQLENISSADFTSDIVTDFLHRHPAAIESLAPYTFFEKDRYTRNQILRNDRFEVLLICWDAGHATPIHNHEGQSCWVHVQAGQLSFTNYKWLGCDRTARTVHLEQASRIPLAAEGSLNVIDERDAIHALANDAVFKERALSLHVYANPLQTCAIYEADQSRCFDQQLSFYSVDGARI